MLIQHYAQHCAQVITENWHFFLFADSEGKYFKGKIKMLFISVGVNSVHSLSFFNFFTIGSNMRTLQDKN